MRSLVFYTIILIGIILIFYLSWLPKPKLGLVWFMPDWLSYWTDADENDTIRTGVPFILLGSAIGVWLLRSSSPWHGWFISWLVLVSIVIIAEVGQLFLPDRSFDWKDIAWGALGAFIGLSSMFLLRQLRTLLSSQ